jgi:hypothetical protein
MSTIFLVGGPVNRAAKYEAFKKASLHCVIDLRSSVKEPFAILCITSLRDRALNYKRPLVWYLDRLYPYFVEADTVCVVKGFIPNIYLDWWLLQARLHNKKIIYL